MPHRASVLVIDDDPVFLKSLASALTESGYAVTQDCCAKMAAHLMASRRFDVAVVDLNLPDENGIELVRQLSTKKPRTKIIAMSGVESDLYLEIARYVGADAAVRKFAPLPDGGFPAQEWLRTVASVLTESREISRGGAADWPLIC
jgi:DNA-binding NarL/FixJ family response regulator